MQILLPLADFPRNEDIPDDDALLDELSALVDGALDDDYILSGRAMRDALSAQDVPPAQDALPTQDRPPKAKTSWKSFVSNALFYLVLIVAVLAVLVYTNSRGGGPRDIFGYSYFTVLTDSMQSVIPRGSIVITKNMPEAQINIGDDITFFKGENTTVTHRVIEIHENYPEAGQRGFVTKGVDNRDADKDIVTGENIVGVVKLSVPRVGAILGLIKENLLLTAVIFGLLILISVCVKIFFAGGEKKKKRRKVKLVMV